MEAFKVVAITHREADLDMVGKFHLEPEKAEQLLPIIKDRMGWEELMYVSTCNRVEFYAAQNGHRVSVHELLNVLGIEDESIHHCIEEYQGRDAVEHLFRVASSLDSMVVGEREIITQVRTAFEQSREWGLTGDSIRVAIRKTIEHAKRVFTETGIAHKPVSVVSLAFRHIREQQLPKDARIVVIGSGQTNTAMTRFLAKAGWTNIHIYNRTKANAEKLAAEFGAKAGDLEDLHQHQEGFDLLLTCTSSGDPIVTEALYEKLLNGEKDRKMIVDLAVPEDTALAVRELFPVVYLSVEKLRPIAEKNLAERKGEIDTCEQILEESLQEFESMYKERQVERAMADVPKKVKEIKATAVDEVFADDLAKLDDESREVLTRMMDYMERKYISVPMKMAKEILLEKRHGK